MTRPSILGFALLATVSIAGIRAQTITWQAQKLPASTALGRYDDIFFISPQVGWTIHAMKYHYDTALKRYDSIVSYGKVWKTVDGGLTWTVQLDSLHSYLRSVRFVDSLHGWVGTLGAEPQFSGLFDTSLLYETTDGGSTWKVADSKISGVKPAGLCGMYAVDTSNVYICGKFTGPAYFLKTTDGGRLWESIDMNGYAARLIDLYFWSKDSGIVVGGTTPDSMSSALVLFTGDGGRTWSERYRSDSVDGWCWKISFPTRKTGYISIEDESSLPHNSYFLKTTDSGRTWQKKFLTSSFADLQGIGFIMEKIGWSGGWFTGLYSSTDGGDSWTYSYQFSYANRFRFFGDSLGYCAGQSIYKVRLRWPPTSVTPEKPSDPSALSVRPYPNPFQEFTQIHFTLSKPSRVTLKVFDMVGVLLLTVLDEEKPAGEYNIPLQLDWQTKQSLPPGTYICELRAGNKVTEQRIVHLR